MFIIRALALLASATSLLASPYPAGDAQAVFDSTSLTGRPEEGVGHFSQWARAAKKEFLAALASNSANEWVLVMGNEGGDLDSMASALTLSYHLTHLDPPQKAVALLQTDFDALDLRPENKLALHYAKMSSGHRDLLTIDELPIKPFDLWHRIKGLAVVDHNPPLSYWRNASVVAIIDHHEDSGIALEAQPRIIQVSASCSSLVTKYILDQGASLMHGGLPVELVELLMRTIAVDSSALRNDSATDVDWESAGRLLELSSWKGRELVDVMGELEKEMSDSRKALETLDLRDLLRRDFKGDSIPTLSSEYPNITLGFAAIPYSMNEQIDRTPEGTSQEWFAVERAFTSEVGVDVSVVLSKHKDKKTKEKVREIAVVVAHGWGKRLGEKAADRLFRQIADALDDAADLPKKLKKWHRPDGKPLLPRRAVWYHDNQDAGRKQIRPIVERAVREWQG